MAGRRTLYDILEVAPAASQETIAAAYRSLCKRFHPDVHPDKHLAEARMKEINQAHAILINPQQRRAYDLKLAQAAVPTQKAEAPQPAGDVAPPWEFARRDPLLRRFFNKLCVTVGAVVCAIALMAHWDRLPHEGDRRETIQEFYAARHGYIEAARSSKYYLQLPPGWRESPLPGINFGPMAEASAQLEQARTAFQDPRNVKTAQQLVEQAASDYRLEYDVNRRVPGQHVEVALLNEPDVQWQVVDVATEWAHRAVCLAIGAILGAIGGWIAASLVRALLDLLRAGMRWIFLGGRAQQRT